jgi:hypothetical protein
VLEELLAAEVLVIGVLDPALAQHFIRKVISVLEDGQPRHQSRRQWRLAGIIRVDLAEAPFQEAPIHRAAQRRQRMLHVDDLIKPRAKQILLSRLSSFPWPHPNLRSSIA